MATDPAAIYTNVTGAFPNVVGVNASGPGATDGTEFIADMVNNYIFGPQQALLTAAGLTPDGIVESSGASQFMTALNTLYGYPEGYIYGVEPSYATASTITIGAGVAKDDADTESMILATSITKDLLSAFVAGTGNGGRDSGMTTAAGDDCHLFLIKNPTTSAVDVLASNSYASPTLPSGYTLKRWIGALVFSGTNVIPDFVSVDNWIAVKTPAIDFSASMTTTASLHVMGVPIGVKTIIVLRFAKITGNIATMISDPDSTDSAPTVNGTAQLANMYAGANDVEFEMTVTTNTSSQVRVRTDGTVTCQGLVVKYYLKR